MQVCILYLQKPDGKNLIRDAKSESCHFLIFSKKFRDTLNLILRRTAICLDTLTTTLFICLDHFPSSLRVTPRSDADKLEQLQLEADRIVTGLTAYASLSSLYAETGREKLNTRRKIRKLSLFYNIVKGDTPII
jgi:hypothetical protein